MFPQIGPNGKPLGRSTFIACEKLIERERGGGAGKANSPVHAASRVVSKRKLMLNEQSYEGITPLNTTVLYQLLTLLFNTMQ
jgi:hypothetical protein